jgi:hypothetical protein
MLNPPCAGSMTPEPTISSAYRGQARTRVSGDWFHVFQHGRCLVGGILTWYLEIYIHVFEGEHIAIQQLNCVVVKQTPRKGLSLRVPARNKISN